MANQLMLIGCHWTAVLRLAHTMVPMNHPVGSPYAFQCSAPGPNGRCAFVHYGQPHCGCELCTAVRVKALNVA